ncbi:zinc ABC transporter substrate-binding protein [Ectothiorhodospira variabilis]|uniref:zinc ABC transporter substrate-binding protein n=1 Tax=Ectothiorhodospira variabilis TaxID=505694 RepID=UPI001EFA7605|nr:zinc ABC transporter substrate-binding protein [Ectothiorhodospira variabilis]MCG5494458.1 zinc ABC transporter substrate-binding protein [Ectothiorhodospira variabilis]MCG5498895.1 zinc ABC transporter substrate-binding protein [Ectothiorhodospira variabilis]MCG5503171.1 zinc ABC transporter substrate-binding protein [Ectothiorhodospira variabilis]MCG5506070.1 zinc ABC transporter substrate-binding protein [Ectothiorhodospira variabilis]
MKLSRLTISAVLGALLIGPVTASAAPQVVVSIPPIHNLVSGVMDGVGEPTLLVPAGASPHSYSMRPSDRRQMQSADVLVWVGPHLETFLERPIATLPESVRKVTLLKDADLTVHSGREGGVWEAHRHDHSSHDGDHGHEHEHHHHYNDHGHDDDHAHGHDHHDHAHGDEGHHDHGHSHGHHVDAHIWLSPDNAAAIVRQVAQVLADADPDNADRYEENRDRMLSRMEALDEELKSRLDPVSDRPFIVFHDAYQYFEKHYGLTPAGSITVDPSRSPGAQRVQALRERIRESDAICVFTEPQFRPAIVETLTEGTGARVGELDPLGARLPAGEESYYRLLENLADSLVDCLNQDLS